MPILLSIPYFPGRVHRADAEGAVRRLPASHQPKVTMVPMVLPASERALLARLPCTESDGDLDLDTPDPQSTQGNNTRNLSE